MLPEAPSANTHERTKKPLNLKINSSPGLSFAAWQEELGDDPDKDFILDGIKHGFNIIDEEIEISPVRCSNHLSAQPGSPLYDKATKQVLKEIENGNYVFVTHLPK